MKKKLIVGNLKMNPISPAEFDRYLDMLEKEIKGYELERTEIVICPPAVFCERVEARKNLNLKLGAQDVFWERCGAYTGETSAAQFKACGARYALVGHSERRKYFGECEEKINAKLKAVLKEGLQPILCIGESLDERKDGQTAKVLRKQIKESLAGVGPGKIESVNVVYEPIWAVGSDNVPTADEILEAKIIIKKILSENYSRKAVENLRILYGGSVAVRFVQQVCIDPAMDGGLVGRESLVPHEFVKIAKIIDES